jgi:hypothetical protein
MYFLNLRTKKAVCKISTGDKKVFYPFSIFSNKLANDITMEDPEHTRN